MCVFVCVWEVGGSPPCVAESILQYSLLYYYKLGPEVKFPKHQKETVITSSCSLLTYTPAQHRVAYFSSHIFCLSALLHTEQVCSGFGFGGVFHVWKSLSSLTRLLKTTLLFLKVSNSGWERKYLYTIFSACVCLFSEESPDPRKRHWLESFHSCNSFPSNTYCTVILSFPLLPAPRSLARARACTAKRY